jgi:hypothetical protein
MAAKAAQSIVLSVSRMSPILSRIGTTRVFDGDGEEWGVIEFVVK